MMEAENARRNLKDFLSMYNQFTETCFNRCIQNLNYRVLTQAEESCTNNCISKLINVNHREISVYMEINPLNRRINEMNAEQNLQAAVTPDLTLEVEKVAGNSDVIASPGETESITSSEPVQSTPAVSPSDLTQESAVVNNNTTSVEDEKT